MSRSLSQPERFIVFVLNVATFYFLYVWATGHWALTNEPKSLWFDAAVASWALSLLSAPFFRPPKDAIGAGVAALLVLVATKLETTQIDAALLNAARYFAIGYALFVIGAAYVAALVERRQHSAIARLSYIAAERLSNGAFLFGLLAVISIFGFYAPAEKVFILIDGMPRSEIDHAVDVVSQYAFHRMRLEWLPVRVQAPEAVGGIALVRNGIIVSDLAIVVESDIVQ